MLYMNQVLNSEPAKPNRLRVKSPFLKSPPPKNVKITVWQTNKPCGASNGTYSAAIISDNALGHAN